MKFFVDTADVDAIRDLADTGLVDGVTTNPSLIAKSGRDFVRMSKSYRNRRRVSVPKSPRRPMTRWWPKDASSQRYENILVVTVDRDI